MTNPASQLYDFFNERIIREKYLEELEEHIRPLGQLNGKKILEIGAGTCKISAEIKRRFPRAEVVASDISQSHLEKGREKAELKTVQCPTERILEELNPESFDLVIAVDTIHHHKNRVKALENVFRLIKPGGLLAMREIDRLLPGYYKYFLIDKSDWLLSKLQGLPYIDPQYFSSQELREVLSMIGFQNIRINELGRDALIQVYAER